jgi:hypothetical protein
MSCKVRTIIDGPEPAPSYHESGNTAFNNLSMPAKLYKYRRFPRSQEDEYQLSEIVQGEIYFAHRTELNDPDEYGAQVQAPSSDEQLKVMLYDHSKEQHPRWNDSAITADVDQLIMNMPSDPVERERQYQANLDDILDELGLYSMSECPYSAELWRDYAENQQGFVIEYDSAELLKELRLDTSRSIRPFLDVKYLSSPAILDPVVNRDWVLWLLASKLATWSHELEWRVLWTGGARRKVRISNKCITKIIVVQGRVDECGYERIKGLSHLIEIISPELIITSSSAL